MTCYFSVDLMKAYSKRQDLANSLVSAMTQLREAQAQLGKTHSVRPSCLSTRQRRVDDRLGEADTEQLIAAFTAGTSKRKLAER
jgi:hypothetical protein